MSQLIEVRMQAFHIVLGKPADRLDLVRDTPNVRFKGPDAACRRCC
jgi:hypothetical protein